MNTKILIAVSALSIALTGCKTTGLSEIAANVSKAVPVTVETGPQVDASQQVLMAASTIDMSQYNQKREATNEAFETNRAMLQGAAIGAVVGGGAAALAGADGEVVGLAAMAGGAAGAWVGNKLDNRTKEIVANRDAANEELARLATLTQNASADLGDVTELIEFLEQENALLRQKIAQGRVSETEAAADRAVIEAATKELKVDIKNRKDNFKQLNVSYNRAIKAVSTAEDADVVALTPRFEDDLGTLELKEKDFELVETAFNDMVDGLA